MIQFNIVQNGEDSFVVAIIPGDPKPLVASKSGNPRFDELIELASEVIQFGLEPDEDEVRNLFSVSKAVAERFESLSDRVIVEGGNVLFDGAVVDNSLAKQIVRFLDEGEDFEPLVNFMGNVMDNPEPHSRHQLYDWLDKHDFTITTDGMIVAYKGVESDGKGGYRSISSGSESVYVEDDGVTTRHTGKIPNPLGAVVSMDRNLVEHNPSVGCHVGLHVGTFEYAKDFSRGTVLEVHVNPRDVRSVPTDCDWAKVRTCRYMIVNTIDAPHSRGLLDPDGYRDDEWEDFTY